MNQEKLLKIILHQELIIKDIENLKNNPNKITGDYMKLDYIRTKISESLRISKDLFFDKFYKDTEENFEKYLKLNKNETRFMSSDIATTY